MNISGNPNGGSTIWTGASGGLPNQVQEWYNLLGWGTSSGGNEDPNPTVLSVMGEELEWAFLDGPHSQSPFAITEIDDGIYYYGTRAAFIIAAVFSALATWEAFAGGAAAGGGTAAAGESAVAVEGGAVAAAEGSTQGWIQYQLQASLLRLNAMRIVLLRGQGVYQEALLRGSPVTIGMARQFLENQRLRVQAEEAWFEILIQMLGR